MTHTIGLKQNKLMMIVMAFVMALGVLFTFNPSADVFAAECPKGAFMDIHTGKWRNAENTADLGDQEVCERITDGFAGKIMGFVTILSTLAFVFAFGMVVYGGIKYIGSQGDERQTEEAKKQMWYAGVGCLIVASAFVIFKMIMKAAGAA